jgi:serine/threonine protein phosphatase 1
MLSRLFRPRPQPIDRPPAAMPPGERWYAVGDVHGRLDLLDTLLGRIADDDAARGGGGTFLFLGDLIDRGPQSAQVIERLLDLSNRHPPGSTRFLLGNHEEVFLLALDGDEQALRFFTRIGGRETILSYGLSEDAYRDMDYAELMAAIQALVPAAHREFLDGFDDLIVAGDYAFAHAGVRPGVALSAQRPQDLRWIRDGFLDHGGLLEKVVVHGHTVVPAVEERPHRIGLDTGAYRSGRLTAMGFEGTQRWLLQTEPA